MQQLTFLLLTAGCLRGAAQAAAPAAEPLPTVAFSSLHFRSRPLPPPYPPLARVVRVQGTVVMGLTVGPEGQVERAEAEAGPVLLRPAAEALCREWRFEPVEVDGRRSRVKVAVGVPFRLQDVPELPGADQAPQVVLAVTCRPVDPALPVDPAWVEAEARASCVALGLVPVSAAEASQPQALHLGLEVQSLRTEDGISVLNVRLRGSLYSDLDLAEDEPGKPERLARAGHLYALSRPESFRESLLDTVRTSIRRLLVQPSPLPKPTQGMPMASPLIPARPVDFEFSQIRVRHQPKPPHYPAGAKLRRIQGTVVIELTIDPTGTPVRAEALEGPAELLMTAIRYGLAWSFEPARLNGVAQYARFKLTMPFRLR